MCLHVRYPLALYSKLKAFVLRAAAASYYQVITIFRGLYASPYFAVFDIVAAVCSSGAEGAVHAAHRLSEVVHAADRAQGARPTGAGSGAAGREGDLA